MPSRGPHDGQKRTPTSRPATRSSSALPYWRQSVEQLLDVVPAHEEVDVLGRAAEQLVAQRAADLVQLAERQLRHAALQFLRHRLLDGDGLGEVARLVDRQTAPAAMR